MRLFLTLALGILIGSAGIALVCLQQEEGAAPASAPTFTWSYDRREVDGIPKTTVSLTAKRGNATPETKAVDTVEGDCNASDSPDADAVAGSTMITCYYAGLGRVFKVVQSGSGYAVQRKIFEEASPDYDPPAPAFETVATFEGA
jgi:hypothetical protein